jgi:UPF0716 family protein affecting phage T7 exclusion
MNPLLWLIGGKSLGDWLKLIGLGLLALLPVIGYFLGRRQGGQVERAQQQERNAEASHEARNIEDAVRRTPPDQQLDELQRWGKP